MSFDINITRATIQVMLIVVLTISIAIDIYKFRKMRKQEKKRDEVVVLFDKEMLIKTLNHKEMTDTEKVNHLRGLISQLDGE
ncbi:MAG: hypothetical protein L0J75_01450 [Alkalibacterium sp.]|nr:hypothetical protein [Alkalibacterium sp.]